VVLDVMLYFLVFPSVTWALVNLLPIFPLDGGQVSRELCVIVGGSDGVRWSLYLSLGVAAAAAMYFLTGGETFNALLFASLAVSNFQLLQVTRFGGNPW